MVIKEDKIPLSQISQNQGKLQENIKPNKKTVKGSNEKKKCRNEDRGLYLYNHGLQRKTFQEKLTKTIINERGLKEMDGVTFKPSINLGGKSSHNKRSDSKKKLEERLMEHFQFKKEKEAKLNYEFTKKWQAKHPFHPNINRR